MHVPLTPIRCLYRAVDLYGKKLGVVSGALRFTYAQVGERCERLAAGLLNVGVTPGDRVAYLSFNSHALFEGYFGAPMIRAVAMPLAWQDLDGEWVGPRTFTMRNANEYLHLNGDPWSGMRKRARAIGPARKRLAG